MARPRARLQCPAVSQTIEKHMSRSFRSSRSHGSIKMNAVTGGYRLHWICKWKASFPASQPAILAIRKKEVKRRSPSRECSESPRFEQLNWRRAGFFSFKSHNRHIFRKCFLSWKGCLEPFIHSLNVYLAPIMQQTWFKVLYDISLKKADKTPCPPKSLPYNERRQAISRTSGKCNQHPPPNLIGGEGSGIQGGEGLNQESQR